MISRHHTYVRNILNIFQNCLEYYTNIEDGYVSNLYATSILRKDRHDCLDTRAVRTHEV